MSTTTNSGFDCMPSEDRTLEQGEGAQIDGDWRNPETWTVYRWILNDDERENWEDQAREAWNDAGGDRGLASRIFGDWMRDKTEFTMPNITGIYCSLLLAALGEVDWQAIAAHILDDANLGEVYDFA
jgi:hypothetical protein